MFRDNFAMISIAMFCKYVGSVARTIWDRQRRPHVSFRGPRDLSSHLRSGSVIGTCGTLYTVLFVWLRLLDGSSAQRVALRDIQRREVPKSSRRNRSACRASSIGNA